MLRMVKGAAAVFAALLAVSPGAFANPTITAAGSTALLPFVKAAADEYQTLHPEVQISVTGGGSGVGITQVAAKAIDLGDSDIPAAGHPELLDHRVAVVGFAVVVNPGVGVAALTRRQVQGIFSGEITNWKLLGGNDLNIVVINRPRSSGTRAVFARMFMDGKRIDPSGLVEDATGTVLNTLETTPGAISYSSFACLRDPNITARRIDGVAPTEENVAHGKYPFWSYEHVFTYGEPNADVARFLAFLHDDEKLARKLGYVPVAAMRTANLRRSSSLAARESP